MVTLRASIAVALATGSLLSGAPSAVSAVPQDELEARLWLDRGDEPVLRRGERVRVYYRSSADAYVAILNIDTDGTTRLVFPRSPDENHYLRGGRDYRLIFPNSSYWHVEDPPGVGYFFIVTSREPFDFSALRYSRFGGGWDMSLVGQRVYSDPYVAVDDFVARVVPDWEYADYALDFTTYHVEQRHQYPRFLCYDCHGFRSYTVWNPYAYTCTTFRVVIYDDPYYYPSYRYRGNRVVYARPVVVGRPRYQFKERAVGETGTPDIRTRTPTGRAPPAAGPVPRRARPRDQRAAVSASSRGSRTAQPRSGSASPSGRVAPTRQAPTTRSDRPTLQRRPTARPSRPSTAGGTSGARIRPPVTRPTTSTRTPARGSRTQTRSPSRPSAGTRAPARTARPPAKARPPARSSRPQARSAPKRPPPRKPPPRASSSSSRPVRKPVKRPPSGGSG